MNAHTRLDAAVAPALAETCLAPLHGALGARMVPFAGYAMPVQYPGGIVAEHLACRTSAALFDVSHMGQASLIGPGAAAAVEALVPGDIAGLAPGRQRYTVLTNQTGGILDDLMVAKLADDHLFLVVNAGRKHADWAHIAARLPPALTLDVHEDRQLLALQGPLAARALERVAPGASALRFMHIARLRVGDADAIVTRSGYTGEDGFEISLAGDSALDIARLLLDQPEVTAAGLGARDSLRLEAGLCLHGQDIDERTTPIEAGLGWIIGKRRRADRGFPGAAIICGQIRDGAPRRRVGIRPDGRAPARAGTAILGEDGTVVGEVTSGTFGPTLNAPIAMGYVPPNLSAIGTSLTLMVRGRALPARVVALPFVVHRFAQ